MCGSRIVSDTHLPRRSRARSPEACVERLRAADAILHAGDFIELLGARGDLQALGPPVHAVRGQRGLVRAAGAAAAVRVVEAGGARIAMLHDAGPAAGRLERMRRRFPDADAVVFGHSHLPLLESARRLRDLQPGLADRAPPRAAPHDGDRDGPTDGRRDVRADVAASAA